MAVLWCGDFAAAPRARAQQPATAPPAAPAPQRSPDPAAPPSSAAQRAPAAGRAPLQPFQRELLQLAFDAASTFPLEPHGKNRSRAQELVVVACFELGEPELALAYGTRIADWRRGCAYADYAWCAAKRGDAARAREYVALARGVAAEVAADASAQQWRRDLITTKIARALSAAGDTAGAAQAAASIDVASTHAVDGDWAATTAERIAALAPAQAAAELAALDAAFPAMTLGQQAVALTTVARLHERFFAERELRAACEQRATAAWTKVPPALRLDALATMVRTSAAHGERAGAGALLATMREVVDGHRWRAEARLPQVARLIELACAVGERERARAEAEHALVAWHEQREQVVDIERAETLRPLALAWHACGEPERAQELLALVLEEAVENPNSRPRCDDLVETCVALARTGVEPTAALWTRLRELQRGLGHPW